MSTEDEVRQACDQYYAALNRLLNGDAGPMMEIWSHSPDVTVLHPVAGVTVGWEQVRASWEQFAQLCSGGQVTLRDPLIRVGTDLAYVVGTNAAQATVAGETISFELRVTHIFRREADGRPSTSTLMSCQRCKPFSTVCKHRQDKPVRSLLNLLQ
jgi:ketosteroid isomerase-like protein